MKELYPNYDFSGMMRAIALEELHRRETPARASFARVSTVRLSLSTYIPATILSMLKDAGYGFNGQMFEVAHQEHDPSLLWCRYLEGTAGSDLPAVIRKMGLN